MNKFLPLPDPILAGLLSSLKSEEFVLLETSRVNEEDHHSFLFTDPVDRLRLKSRDGVLDFFEKAQHLLDEGYYLAGRIDYEAGYLLEPSLAHPADSEKNYSLADLGVFRAPLLFDHRNPDRNDPTWVDFSRKSMGHDATYCINELQANLTKDDYLAAIDAIKSYIAAGDTYQVNYTLKLLFDFSGSPAGLYRDLRRNQSVSYGAFIQSGSECILSLSPELFFRKKGDVCTVRPMKGTMKRGKTNAEDENNEHFLRTDSKNRSENVMIVDLLRNDLGRISRPGTVCVSSLFDVEKYETLHQMTSSITGKIPSPLALFDLFKALFPCGSVTGAPKIRTMEIIRELEHGNRGVYTGAIGYLAPSGDAEFNVPIRTVVLHGPRGEMGIGSGIVHDSDPEGEWQECNLKADFLTRPMPEFQLIETILWQPEKGYWLLDEHLARLVDSSVYYNFAFDPEEILQAVREKEEVFRRSGENQRLRLLLAKDGSFTLHAEVCDAPQTFFTERADKLPRVYFSNEKTDSSDAFLFHKTTMRQLYNRERKKAVDAGYYEVLFCNERGEVTEGAISTVFIKKDNCFFTPSLQCGLLPGVFRANFLAGKAGVTVREKILFPQDLKEADAVFVANSVRGIVQVRL